MSWVDLRIPAGDAAAATQALVDAELFSPFSIDPHPPSAGPEVEITVSGGYAEAYLRGILSERGISVLAARARDWRRGEP
jgi:hypothetical protein